MLKSNHYRPNIKKIIPLNELAVKYRKQNNLREAYKICKQIYELDPAPDILKQSVNLGVEHMRYHLILGEILYLENNFIKAQKILNSLKPLGKSLSDKYLILAKIHLKNKDYTKALQEYEDMIITCTHRFKAILNGLLSVIKQNPFIERSYKLIFMLYKNRGMESSVLSELKHKLKEENYQQHHLVCIFGLIYHYMGKTSRAISIFTQYQKDNPKDAKSLFFIGNILLETGKYPKAIKLYNHVIELDISRKTDIIASIEEVSKIKKLDNTIINYLVDLYIEEDKLEEAEKELDHLLELESNDSQNQNKMEQVLTKAVDNTFINEQMEICMSKLEKLTKLRPEDDLYKRKMKEVQGLITRKKINEYEERLKAGDLSDEKEDNIRFDLAKLYVDTGIDEERSISLLQKVAKSNFSNKPEALSLIGLNFLSKGYNDIAFDNFNKLLTLSIPDKEKLRYLYQIAIAYEGKNLQDKAKFFYEKIISINMQYKDVSQRLKKISVVAKSVTGKALMTNMNQKFENIEKIGEGNIWVFYKAVDKLLKRKVVITVIKEDFRYDPEAIDRLITETQHLSKSHHKGIVKVYDVNIDILLYIVMEHIDGESLRSITKKKPFYWQEVIKIATDICDAIKCAHKQKVIHRDIRPDNIRLTNDNTVKISGFGLSHITNVPMAKKTDLRDEMLYYKSPEQIKGIEKEIGERSDIYSLGITLYELLTGHVPFCNGDIAYQHINEPPKSLRLENPEIPRWLDKIVLKCLEKDPSDRYEGVDHLQKTLDSYSRFYMGK